MPDLEPVFDFQRLFAEVVKHVLPVVRERGEHVEMECIAELDSDVYRLRGYRFFEGRERQTWRVDTVIMPASPLRQLARYGRGELVDELLRHAKLLYGGLIAERPKFRILTRKVRR